MSTVGITTPYVPGTLVRARGREWVVLPRDDPEVLMLRPLGGADRDAVGLFLPLEGHDVVPATFPPPDPAEAGDNTAGALLRDADRGRPSARQRLTYLTEISQTGRKRPAMRSYVVVRRGTVGAV
jgi:hypothetical protein